MGFPMASSGRQKSIVEAALLIYCITILPSVTMTPSEIWSIIFKDQEVLYGTTFCNVWEIWGEGVAI